MAAIQLEQMAASTERTGDWFSATADNRRMLSVLQQQLQSLQVTEQTRRRMSALQRQLQNLQVAEYHQRRDDREVLLALVKKVLSIVTAYTVQVFATNSIKQVLGYASDDVWDSFTVSVIWLSSIVVFTPLTMLATRDISDAGSLSRSWCHDAKSLFKAAIPMFNAW